MFLSLCLIAALHSVSQSKDSKGTDFWITFPGNYFGGDAKTLFISSETNTTGTVTVPGLGFSTSFTVAPGTTTSVSLPNNVTIDVSDAIENKGIHVTSLEEITIYGLSRIVATTDAFLALPTDILGTEYINLGFGNVNILNGTQFGIVATEDGTSVTITPTVTTNGHTAGIPYTITLNQGQTYFLRNTNPSPDDLSGSLISSDKPIAVFGSHQCANIPNGNVFACDYLVEQLSPVSAWGKNFVAIPLKTRLNGDTFRFLASKNNTSVSVNGVSVATLNKGQFFQTIISGSSQITSSEPILVAQYSNGTTYDNVTSDPFKMLIFPYEQFLNSYTITTPASGFRFNFANVVAPSAAVGSIKMDDVTIPSSAFAPIGSSGFYGAQVDLSLGTHNFNGTNLPFGIFVYGFDQADSYGYPGGGSLSPIATVSSVSISPKTGSAVVNTETCFDATVKDQFDAPVEGVRVDFTITGPNSSNTAFANTDVNGIAHFCYTGANEGSDNITASVGTINDAASFTWNNACNVTVSAKKFYDLNADGLDNDGIAVQGWSISLSGTDENSVIVGPVIQTTNPNGTTDFTSVAKGNYTVSEGTQGNWISTTPTSVSLNITDCNNPDQIKFGNVCIGAGTTSSGTFAPGYWTNKNGQSLIIASYLCELNNLCLRDASGNNFDPVANCPAPTNQQVNAGKTNLKDWLTNATAINMSYMLSAQLAAMKLNVLKGIVDGAKLVYAPGTSSANAAGFATVNAIMTEANTMLCANAIINASSSLRNRAEAVKNALENANNNRNFVQTQPCSFTQSTIVQKAQRALPTQITENSLFLKATPNPSRNYFNLQITSNNTNQGIAIRIFNSNGQLVEVKNNLKGGQVVQIGNNLRSGVYLIEAVQGNERKTQTVIKQ
jgi:hypothetical protein